MGIAKNYERVRSEVIDQAIKAGRAPEDVLLLAVSKTVDVDGVREAISGGAHSFGENRPDQLMEKHLALPNEDWHFIGNIQSRRIKDIVPCANLIHSLYEQKHAEKINAVASDNKKIQDVLIEVNVSGEESKSGIAPDDLLPLMEAMADMDNICIRGLMTMAPQGDLSVARQCFSDLRDLQESAKGQLPKNMQQAFCELSMGMSEDWREAILEGSTIIRVGRAIFSDNFSQS